MDVKCSETFLVVDGWWFLQFTQLPLPLNRTGARECEQAGAHMYT